MVIMETSIFTRQIREMLPDEEYRFLQIELINRPESGKVIPRSGGLRKLRWSVEGRGKRGGIRIIYYRFVSQENILLLFAYPKNVQDDLTEDQLRQLRKIVEGEYR